MNIRELADQAGIDEYDFGYMDITKTELDKFAALVAAHEREECAKVCETAQVPIDIDVWQGTKKALSAATALGLAAAIRARGKA